jgi:hypothetical protein
MARVEIDVVTRLTGINELHSAATNVKSFVDEILTLGKSVTSVDSANKAISALTREAANIKQLSGAFGQAIDEFNKLDKAQQQTGKITKETADALKNIGYNFKDIGSVKNTFADLNNALFVVKNSLSEAKVQAKEFKENLGFESVLSNLSSLSSKLASSFGGLGRVSSDILGMATAFLSVRGAMNLVSDGYKIIQRDQEALGKLAVVYENATAQQLKGELQNIKDISNEMGVAYEGSIRGFAQLGVAMKKAGESGEDIQKSFANMTKIAAGLQLSGEATTRLYAAVTQGFNKTKIQSEELVQQFGELVPGAAALAKEALADVFPDMHAALKKGQIDATHWNVILQHIVENLDKAIVASQTSLRAQINRIKNAWDDLLNYMMLSPDFSKTMNKSLSDVFVFLKSTDVKTLLKELFDVISGVINVTLALVKQLTNLANVLNGVIPGGLSTVILAFIGLTTTLGSLLTVAKLVEVALAFKGINVSGITYLGGKLDVVRNSLLGVSAGAGKAVVAINLLRVAFKALLRVALVGLLIEVGTYIWEITDGFKDAREAVNSFFDSVKSNDSIVGSFNDLLVSLKQIVYFCDTVAYTIAALFTKLPAIVAASLVAVYDQVKLSIANIKLEFARTGWDGIFARLEYAAKLAFVNLEYVFKKGIPSLTTIGTSLARALIDPLLKAMQAFVDGWNTIRRTLGESTIDVNFKSSLDSVLKANNEQSIKYEQEKNTKILALRQELENKLQNISNATGETEVVKTAEAEAKAAAHTAKQSLAVVATGWNDLLTSVSDKFNANVKKAKDGTKQLADNIEDIERASSFAGKPDAGITDTSGVNKLSDRLKALKKDLTDVINGFNQLQQVNAKAGRDSTLQDRLEQVKIKYQQLLDQASRLKDVLSDADLEQIYAKLDNNLKAKVDALRSTGVSLGEALYNGIVEGINQQKESIIAEQIRKVEEDLKKFSESLTLAFARESGSEVAKVTAEYSKQTALLDRQQKLINEIALEDTVRAGYLQQQLDLNRENLNILTAEKLEYAEIKDAVAQIVEETQRLKDITGIFQDLAEAALISGNELQELAEAVIPALEQNLEAAVATFEDLTASIDWGDPKQVAQVKQLSAAIRELQEELLEARYAAGEFTAAIQKALPDAFQAATDTMMDFFEAVGKGEKSMKDWKEAAIDAVKQFAVTVLKEMLAQRMMLISQTMNSWINSWFGGPTLTNAIGNMTSGISNAISGGMSNAATANATNELANSVGSSLQSSVTDGITSGISNVGSGLSLGGDSALSASGSPVPVYVTNMAELGGMGAGGELKEMGTQIKVVGDQAQVAGTQVAIAGTEAQTAGTQAQAGGTGFAVAGTETQIAGMEAQVGGTGFAVAGTEAMSSGTMAQVGGTGFVVAGTQVGIAGASASTAGMQASVAATQVDGLSSSISGLGNQATQAQSKLTTTEGGEGGFFSGLLDKVKNGFSWLTDSIGSVFSGLWDFLSGIFGSIANGISSIFSGITSAFSGAGSWLGGLFLHSGGIVGAGNRRKKVSPFAFVGAPRYHSGGFAGFAPDEYPAILQRNEEILAANDPRNSLNGKPKSAANDSMNVEIINQIDSKEVLSNALNNATGRRILVNAIQTERSRISAILG